uniref:Uncharacterized protein LOC102807323 n=1 Tax=Saccoglossus kowalevskii TaxID=10224 RepID=A0ABM0MF22_SACKO|nr:PREDICTED: uncharacterized protein LOC102807323 [Saccoglossus kowalevskii]
MTTLPLQSNTDTGRTMENIIFSNIEGEIYPPIGSYGNKIVYFASNSVLFISRARLGQSNEGVKGTARLGFTTGIDTHKPNSVILVKSTISNITLIQTDKRVIKGYFPARLGFTTGIDTHKPNSVILVKSTISNITLIQTDKRVIKACTAIANCQQLHCTSSTNQACHRCNYDRGGDIIAYQLLDYGGYPNRICELNTSPIMQYCLGTLIQTTGDYRADADCDDHVTAPTTVYTNIQPDRIQVEWHNSYTGPNAADWPQQYYVEDFKVGVISASYDWWVIRGETNVKSGIVTCSIGYSQDNPHQAMHDCDVTGDIVFTFQHEDRFYFTAKARNGGYITIRNYDATSGYTINPKNYYTGVDVAHTADFTLDYQPPTHCTVTGSCSDHMLDRGPAITKTRDITVQYIGWHDDLSGILRYEYEVYKMQAYGDVLGYRSIPPVMSGQVDPPAKQFTITLNDPGVYCVMLTVDDVAGNHIRARRFLIFDDVNGVNTTDQFPIWVDSAAENTTHIWQTDLQDSNNTGPQIVLQWPGHFYNWFHREHKFLNAIEDNSPPLTPDYEEVTGQPPTTRSREAIPNVNAIVRFEVNYGIDHQGGRTITSSSENWRDVDNIKVEKQKINIPRRDGDSIHLWVRATDVMGNTNQDDVLIHVDSSPLIFRTFDEHSGLLNIHWNLTAMSDATVSLGEENIAIRRPLIGVSLCDLPSCACIPKDGECYFTDYAVELDGNLLGIPTEEHDENKEHDYLFTITITNNAMLTTTRSTQIRLIQKSIINTEQDMITVNASALFVGPLITTPDYIDTNLRTQNDILLPSASGTGTALVVIVVTIIVVVVLCRRKKASKETERDNIENAPSTNQLNNTGMDEPINGIVGNEYTDITENDQHYMTIIKNDVKVNEYESIVGGKQHYADVNKNDIQKNVYETPTNVKNNEYELVRY